MGLHADTEMYSQAKAIGYSGDEDTPPPQNASLAPGQQYCMIAPVPLKYSSNI